MTTQQLKPDTREQKIRALRLCLTQLIVFTVVGASANSISFAAFEDLGSAAISQSSLQPPTNVVEALKSCETMDPQHKATVYASFRAKNDYTPTEIKAIYEAMRREEKNSSEPFFAENMRSLGFALSKGTSEEAKTVVATLFSEEVRHLPRSYYGPLSTRSKEEADKEASRYYRFEGLLKAIADGHNQLAVAEVKTLSQRDDLAGQLAISALQTMGEVDISNLILRIENDAHFRVDLGKYGPTALNQIVAEVRNVHLDRIVRGILLEKIADSYGHNAVPVYADLLNDDDPDIRKEAARGLAKAVEPTDSAVVEKMLKSRDLDVRLSGTSAADRAWTEQYANSLITILQNDTVPPVRLGAMYAIANHHVYAAVPALKQASKDPGSALVRGMAVSVLQQLGQK